MSHWSKGKVKIKDLITMDMVAKKAGINVSRQKVFNSPWAGDINCERVYEANGGGAAIVSQADGSYNLMMDNYHNPITKVIGQNGSKLMQDYSIEIVHQQAMQMGGVISNQEVLADGSVELEIQVA